MRDMPTIADADKRQAPAEVRVPGAVYSRIVGYLTDVNGWNTGKRQEFAERVTFEVEDDGREPDLDE
jgi:hypothetical protein